MTKNRENDSRFTVRREWLFLALLGLFLHGCAWMVEEEAEYRTVKSKRITFSCDEHINDGMLLPVDIIYITRYHMPREVFSIGPERWFDSAVRDNWEERQALSLNGGDVRTVELNPNWLKDTKFLIIIADFKNTYQPYPQQVIIDEDGKSHVKLLILPGSMIIAPPSKPCLWF